MENQYLSPAGSHTRNATLSSAVTLTTPSYASYILVQALGANIRYTIDGQTPTATLGFQLRANDSPFLIPVRLDSAAINLKVIQESSGAEIQYQFMG